MRRTLSTALLLSALALPAGAIESIEGILVEPRNPTPSDRIRFTVVGTEALGCPLVFRGPFYETATGKVVLRTSLPDCVTTPIYQPFRRTLESGPLPAGLHFAEVWFDDFRVVSWREIVEVREDGAQLDLGEDDRFRVRLHWTDPRDGSSEPAHARRLAQDSGAFWFFSPENLEVTVKVLDGRAVNGHWWVFIASMTDLPFEIEIQNGEGGPVKTYVQSAGANRNFIDTGAFQDGPATARSEATPLKPGIEIEPEPPTPSDPVRVEVAVINTEPDVRFTGIEGHRLLFDYNTYAYPADRPFPPLQRFTARTAVGPLAPGVYSVDVREDLDHVFGRTFEVAAPGHELLLQHAADSYFTVSVHLDPPLDMPAFAVPLTRESGYFWFFGRDNVELTLKILDGRPINGKYWVFLASMTDVGFTAHVRQCPEHGEPAPCVGKVYRSTPGVSRNIIDTSFEGF